MNELKNYLEKYPSCLILEYLPGDEYTVDCFMIKTENCYFMAKKKESHI
jgi:hypothetical protein